MSLVVRNLSYFDVNVYSVTSTVQSRTRLGMVSGNSEMRLSVPARNLTPGGMLQLYVHAIGSRGAWVSPAVSVASDAVACLDILSGPNGDLSRSSLFTMPIVLPDTVYLADTLAMTDTIARAVRSARRAAGGCSSLGASNE